MASPVLPRCIQLARTSIQVIGEETLIYDEIHHLAWCLNKSSACIWRLCDGRTSVEEIALTAASELNAPVTREIVLLTLGELREKNLLDPEIATLLPDSITRREMMNRAGVAAAGLLPAIASILAPSARAQSGSLVGMAKPEQRRSEFPYVLPDLKMLSGFPKKEAAVKHPPHSSS